GQLKADKEASDELEKLGIHRPGKNASKEEVENYQKQLIATDAYKQVMGKYGTGGDYQRVAQAVTAALQGLAGGDIGSALAGASAPYLAQLIKKTTGDNPALNTMAHAVLGAAVAQAQGNSAIAGAAGAAGGELAARLITQQLYGTSDTSSLSEEQKQTVAALSTLAAGLAGGIAKGDSAGAIAGAGAGKNAVENNLLANKYGVEKLNETSLVALHEKLVAAKIGGMNDLQEKFSACAGDGGCERAVRNEYRQREKESGENLVALYQAGGLSQEELNLLFGKYARIMMEGAKEGQLNSGWGGILGNIYTLNGNDWTPIGTISNPYLAIVRSSEQISEWKKQGLSDEKIRELSLKDGVISSVLAPVDVNGVTNLLNNGASKEELVQFAMIAAFGRVASGSSKLSKVTDGSGGVVGTGKVATNDTSFGAVNKTVIAERVALPAGYREGGSVGAAFNETGGLPEGYRRVVNTKTGNIEVLAADGKLYFETGNGLRPKVGGNLAGLVEAEKNIAGPKVIPESSYPSLAKPSPNAPSNVILGELDSLGRPTGVTAVLREDSLGGGSSANPAIRPPGFEGQPANHARGHLLANSLGGAGDDARNLVTLFQRNANHPNMSSFERQVRGAVQSGETVSYRAVPIYTGTNPMPIGVTLSARGSGGFTLDVSIPNVSGVK
ncbi:DNA/RNA non-specific endonuclease, partial [Pseudomonas protegens]|uniref:DNA/RNA non-specific endonuclease n=1 Tax=Pseudomonas protegens TaxID=380021 RepID=UPI00276A2E68